MIIRFLGVKMLGHVSLTQLNKLLTKNIIIEYPKTKFKNELKKNQ